MRVREIVERIDRLAPFELAESWDHVGLQVGTPDDEVEGVLVALEADDATLDEAARLDCGLVLAHHPLIFEPLARLTDEEPTARVALRAARERRAVVVAHTNLDKARGGLADLMAEALGLRGAQPLEPSAVDWFKLVGFVPPDDADLVRKALFSVGAGVIGEYEHCSWGVEGQGTFFAGEGASPVLGERGRDESVTEVRLEVVFPRRLRRRVVAAYVAAHPYEEPAFDIVPVENVLPGLGLGRLGALPEPVPLARLAADVAALVGLPSPRYAGDGARRVRRVACLPGSGGAALTGGLAAALAAVADVLVTGDVKYHEAREALDAGLALVDAPHDLTEEELVLRWSAALAEVARRRRAARDLPAPAWRVAAQRGRGRGGRRGGCGAGIADLDRGACAGRVIRSCGAGRADAGRRDRRAAAGHAPRTVVGGGRHAIRIVVGERLRVVGGPAVGCNAAGPGYAGARGAGRRIDARAFGHSRCAAPLPPSTASTPTAARAATPGRRRSACVCSPRTARSSPSSARRSARRPTTWPSTGRW